MAQRAERLAAPSRQRRAGPTSTVPAQIIASNRADDLGQDHWVAELRHRPQPTDDEARRAMRTQLSDTVIAELKRHNADLIESTPFQSADERVRALPPVDRWRDPYWRLEYAQQGQRRQPSGGRTRATAERKMALGLHRLDADPDSDLQRRRGDEVLDAWLAPGQAHKSGQPCSPGNSSRITAGTRTATSVPCWASCAPSSGAGAPTVRW